MPKRGVRRAVVFALAMLAAFAASAMAERGVCRPPYDLGRELAEDSAFYVTWEKFAGRHPGIGYSPDGDFRREIRSSDVLFWGRQVSEATLIFSEGGLVRANISVFNKGVDGAYLEESSAVGLIDELRSEVWCRRVDECLLDDGDGKSVTHYTWLGASPNLVVSVGIRTIGDTRLVEFLNVRISIEDEPVAVAADKPSRNVRKDGGDVFIENIPMVNQGRKGYCVPATIERLLRYYGINADMHSLALVMETELGGGTRVGGDFPSLTRIAEDTDLTRTDYCNIGDPHDERGFSRFRDGVFSSIRKGHPLLWAVDRLFPWDSDSGANGAGHMRLIVGYNRRTREILYSDSWGSGNEFKRAPIRDAWSVTVFLSCLAP